MKADWFKPSQRRIRRHLSVLCDDIGERLAGGKGEQQAADYIEREFARLGLDSARQERFAFPNWRVRKIKLKVGPKRPTRTVPSGPYYYSPSTPPAGVKGKLIYLQSGLDLDFKQQNLKGKIGLIIGTESIQDEAFKRRINGSELAGLLTVDSRIVYNDVYPIGAAPQWMADLKVPMISVPYRTAIELVKALPLQAHLAVSGRCSIDQSQNVIGEITGRRWPDEIIYISGHHDSVWDCVGANDNASGVILALEIARLLAKRRPGRTVRFISFGVEERLSVGAYVHVRLLGRDARKVRLAVNADAISSAVGVDTMTVTATGQAAKLTAEHFKACRHPAKVVRDTTIFSDHFPFNIIGVPSLYLGRPSLMDSGHWTLHTKLDNLKNSDPAVLARSIATIARLLDRLARLPRFPIPRRLGKDLDPRVRQGAKQGYRHPWPIRRIDGISTLMPPDKRWNIKS